MNLQAYRQHVYDSNRFESPPLNLEALVTSCNPNEVVFRVFNSLKNDGDLHVYKVPDVLILNGSVWDALDSLYSPHGEHYAATIVPKDGDSEKRIRVLSTNLLWGFCGESI